MAREEEDGMKSDFDAKSFFLLSSERAEECKAIIKEKKEK